MGTMTPRGLCWQGRGRAPSPSPSPAQARLSGHAQLVRISPTPTGILSSMPAPPFHSGMLHISRDDSQIHGKVPTNNILQLCSTAASVRRHCQASATRGPVCGTLHSRGIVLCLAAATNTTTINNHSLKPRYSFTPSQLQNKTRRMVARGDVTWPELPAQ